MTKNIFFVKKLNNFYYILFLFIFIIIIYLIFLFININKPYFIIKNSSSNFYIIPKDKEGEKVKFLDKKSINNFYNIKEIDLKLNEINNLKYSIQLFSDITYEEVKYYMENFIRLKSQLINLEDLYLFSVKSEIGVDYFLSYKNFSSKNEAINYCNISNYLDNCLILNVKNE